MVDQAIIYWYDYKLVQPFYIVTSKYKSKKYSINKHTYILKQSLSI